MEISLTSNLASQVIEVIDTIANKFGVVLDWSKENALPKLQEIAGRLLSYEVATSILWCVVCSIPLAVCFILYIVGRNRKWDADVNEALLILTIIAGMVWLVVCTSQAFDIVECRVFPEKYILEYVQKIMKTGK